MRKITILAVALFLAVVARAKWAMVSTGELLQKTDLVVVARLTDVQEVAKGDTDYGSGVLIVSEIIQGDPKTARRLKLEWSNHTGLICPRIEHRYHGDKPLIWLLNKERNGSVSADYPGRVIPLEERARVSALLKK